MSIWKYLLAGTVIAGMSLVSPAANAGPFIFAGTDADDHGFVSGGTNFDGWQFMQKVLQNLRPGVTNGNTVVVSLGSDPGTQAGDAAASAFSLSTLAGLGWTFQSVNSAPSVTAFLTGSGPGTISAAGIIMLDSASFNVSGGLDSSERAALSTDASALNAFVAGGGGLFSQANGYGFLSALGLTVTVAPEFNGNGISLTPAGTAAFPGLTSADLSSGPYHSRFDNVGALTIFGTSNDFGTAIIIGAAGGSITAPDPIPEPATMAILGLGMIGLAAARRHRTTV